MYQWSTEEPIKKVSVLPCNGLYINVNMFFIILRNKLRKEERYSYKHESSMHRCKINNFQKWNLLPSKPKLSQQTNSANQATKLISEIGLLPFYTGWYNWLVQWGVS